LMTLSNKCCSRASSSRPVTSRFSVSHLSCGKRLTQSYRFVGNNSVDRKDSFFLLLFPACLHFQKLSLSCLSPFSERTNPTINNSNDRRANATTTLFSHPSFRFIFVFAHHVDLLLASANDTNNDGELAGIDLGLYSICGH